MVDCTLQGEFKVSDMVEVDQHIAEPPLLQIFIYSHELRGMRVS